MRRSVLIMMIAVFMVSCSKNKTDFKEMESISKEAYVYAYAAVENSKLIGQLLRQGGANNLMHLTHLATPADRSVVTPNNDTYYSQAILDLRAEPVVITVPPIKDRYFSIQLIDIFTNCPDYISPAATGDDGGDYLIVPKGWNGIAPAGAVKIEVASTILLALFRTQAFSNPDPDVFAIQSQYKVMTLSRFTGESANEAAILEWPAYFEPKTGGVEPFYDIFNYMLQFHLLNDDDKALIERFSTIGIKVGKTYSRKDFTEDEWSAIEKGANSARDQIKSASQNLGTKVNGWGRAPDNSGNWGTDYITRASAAWQYLYVNTPQEAIYYTCNVDGNGQKLNASTQNYTLTFQSGGLPNARYFWSITMYDEEGFLIENEINRYLIKSLDQLVANPDGSITLTIQKAKPTENIENWLPAPDGVFYLVCRNYGPDEATINNTYRLPPVTINN